MPHNREISLLKELLEPKAQGAVEHHSSTNTPSIVLLEKAAEAKIRRITITHLGRSPFVLLPEKGQGNDRRYSPLLAKPAGYSHHQACDAVLFFEKNGTHYEVFIELKSDSPKGCEKQFQATSDFIDYVRNVLASQKQHKCVERQRRWVVFNTSRDTGLKNKQGTHPKNLQYATTIYVKVTDGETIAPNRFFC